MTTFIVVNDCASAPPGAIDVRWKATSPTVRSNWTFDYAALAKALPQPLSPVQQDWLEVFGALYAVDRLSPRPPFMWTREIEVDIPVRDTMLWTSAASALRDVWNRLTGDRLTVRFHQETNPLPPPRTDGACPQGVTGAALFSGGIDSFAAVAELVSNGQRPVAVSHMANPAVTRAVKALLARLPGVPRPAPLPIMAKNGAHSGLTTDESQRARSLLYIASAIIAATAFGQKDVWVGENGILAVHEPETEARVPSLSTRTAHPQVLAAIQRMATVVLGNPVNVSNPLEHLTKAGVVRLCQSLGLGNHIPESVSCWKISRNPEHCGICIPCLHRFVATDITGCPDLTYRTNPWQAAGPASGADDELDNLTHLIQLAQAVDRASDIELELERPGLIGVGGTLTDRQRIALHRDWAAEVLDVASRHPRSAALL